MAAPEEDFSALPLTDRVKHKVGVPSCLTKPGMFELVRLFNSHFPIVRYGRLELVHTKN